MKTKQSYYLTPKSSEFFVKTVEFYHPSFTSPIRLSDYDFSRQYLLDATAVLNPNSYVEFQPSSMTIKRGQRSEMGVSPFEITFSHLSALGVYQALKPACLTTTPIVVYYREYAKDGAYDTANFSDQILSPVPFYTVENVAITHEAVVVYAKNKGLSDRRLQSKVYNRSECPTL